MTDRTDDWRHWLGWKVAWLLIFKVAALLVIWLLFFSPTHRVSVDPATMSDRMAPRASQPVPPTTPHSTQDDRDDA